MWTTHYRNQRGYGRNWDRRYNRWGRYPRMNWRNMESDSGYFECGSKDHWARNSERRKGVNRVVARIFFF